jgi:hypothetical protein
LPELFSFLPFPPSSAADLLFNRRSGLERLVPPPKGRLVSFDLPHIQTAADAESAIAPFWRSWLAAS